MTNPVHAAGLYTDFSAFSRLRAQAREGSREGARAAAEQVEALLLGMMLKSMRAGAGGGLTGAGGDVQQGLHDSQMAMHLARGGHLGFAELMLREIAPEETATGDAAAAPARGFPAPARNPLLGRHPRADADAPVPAAPAVAEPATARELAPAQATAALERVAAPPAAAGWSSPEAFARELWPAASHAARELGTEPEAVLAVAALETGWGRHMPRREDGTPSYNLFGIKAHGWEGAVTRSPTLEFEHGAFARRVEPFRAYDSPQAAFADFVAFLRQQPRYREALDKAADPVVFVHALHRAGYATDPRYGDKLESLLRSETLGRARLASAGTPASRA